jgi:hypothetical protein
MCDVTAAVQGIKAFKSLSKKTQITPKKSRLLRLLSGYSAETPVASSQMRGLPRAFARLPPESPALRPDICAEFAPQKEKFTRNSG